MNSNILNLTIGDLKDIYGCDEMSMENGTKFLKAFCLRKGLSEKEGLQALRISKSIFDNITLKQE